MPPVLWYWLKALGTDVGGMTAKAERSHQHPAVFCCCTTDGSRGAVWEIGVCHGSVPEERVWSGTPSYEKKLHSLTFMGACECLCSPYSGCKHSEGVGGTF